MPPLIAETKFQRIATPKDPFVFADGKALDNVSLAYETYGTLNAAKNNAVLVFHALSGSHHAAGINKIGPGNEFWNEELHLGWWDPFIGPGKGIDTNRYFVICANFLGGCYGSSGPASINPRTKKPYGGSFPYPTISDVVDGNLRLVKHFGIKQLVAAIGGSIGGCCVMNLAMRHPDLVHCVIPIASGLRATILAKAQNFEQIFAIHEDANFQGGNYYEGERPTRGLTLARMISHKTFISLSLIESRARKEIIQPKDVLEDYKLRHQVESYMLHQGMKFTKRFDANSYLRIVSAWQSFDLPKELHNGEVSKCFAPCKSQDRLVFTINSDVCFFPEEQAEIATALKANRVDYQHITVHSEKGHDSFLLEPELYLPYISFKLALAHESVQRAAAEFTI